MILCAGEALIDMLPRQSTHGEDAYAPYAGGAVFNTAIALGRLGAQTGFFSGFSSDFFGDLLKSKLADSNVDAALSVTRDRPCTVAFVKLVDGHATYAFYDENTAGRMLSNDDLPPCPTRSMPCSVVAYHCRSTPVARPMRRSLYRLPPHASP